MCAGARTHAPNPFPPPFQSRPDNTARQRIGKRCQRSRPPIDGSSQTGRCRDTTSSLSRRLGRRRGRKLGLLFLAGVVSASVAALKEGCRLLAARRVAAGAHLNKLERFDWVVRWVVVGVEAQVNRRCMHESKTETKGRKGGKGGRGGGRKQLAL